MFEIRKKRFQNIRLIENNVSRFEKKIWVRNYYPGHLLYSFGHYPSRKVYIPGEKDFQIHLNSPCQSLLTGEIVSDVSVPVNSFFLLKPEQYAEC